MDQDEFPVMLERKLKLRVNVNQALVDIKIEVGYPYRIKSDMDAAACPVSIRGDIGRVADIHGIDSIGAVQQALKFLDQYLRASAERQFYWPDGEPF